MNKNNNYHNSLIISWANLGTSSFYITMFTKFVVLKKYNKFNNWAKFSISLLLYSSIEPVLFLNSIYVSKLLKE